MMEVDTNDNPLRSILVGGMPSTASGFATRDDSASPDLSWLASFRVDH